MRQLLLALLLLLPRAALAEVNADITAYGEVTASTEHVGVTLDEDGHMVRIKNLSGIRYVGRSSDITAQMCLSFGVSVQLSGSVPDEVLARVEHPPMERMDGSVGTRETFTTGVRDGHAYAGWTFDEKRELQAGDWTISFLSGGTVLAQQTFRIAVPKHVDSLCEAPTS